MTQDLDTLRPDDLEANQSREEPSKSQLEKLCLNTEPQTSAPPTHTAASEDNSTKHKVICTGRDPKNTLRTLRTPENLLANCTKDTEPLFEASFLD